MDKKQIKSELTFIKGVGEKRAEALAEEGIFTRKDLISYFPRAYIDRNAMMSIEQIKKELFSNQEIHSKTGLSFNIKSEYTIVAKVSSKEEKGFSRYKRFLIIYVKDAFNGTAKIVFFNRAKLFDKIYQRGLFLSISGTPEIDSYSGLVSFSHPDIDIIDSSEAKIFDAGGIIPKYKITDKMKQGTINNKILSKIIHNILSDEHFKIQETISEELRKKYNFPDTKTAIFNIHFPQSQLLLEKSKEKMKFDELFYFNFSLKLKRELQKERFTAPVINPKSKLARELYENLDFDLTKDQKKVLREIASDISTVQPMNRLLQGDVGSGKTIVAVLTMLQAIDSGYQVAFMAPTEILAEQHYHTLRKYFEKFELNVVQLVGGQKKKQRAIILQDILEGKANVIVGTHALFQSEIQYNKLGLVIIDEQHRFGVAQRADLLKLASESFDGDKDMSPHILVMSATPIPRTLSMTFYGDLDISIIKTMPKNRKPIKTKIVFDSNRSEVFEFIRDELKNGRQAYIVYPLVEKSEKLELKSAVEHFELIDKTIYPSFKCGLLHGQMFWYEKEETMNNFLAGEYDILVATTVIEVGIDIPNASIMLIEDAERFGLSQLHQLRGRVGRGTEQSYCFLVTKENFKYQIRNKAQREEEKKAAIIRLRTMEDTTDGFEIAEVDLKLRGPGDVMGKRQSGIPEFKFADLIKDTSIIENAKTEVENILKEDPQLRQEKNTLIRNILKQKAKKFDFFDIA
jgi:ATP-dependent DNA helicase RecG